MEFSHQQPSCLLVFCPSLCLEETSFLWKMLPSWESFLVVQKRQNTSWLRHSGRSSWVSCWGKLKVPIHEHMAHVHVHTHPISFLDLWRLLHSLGLAASIYFSLSSDDSVLSEVTVPPYQGSSAERSVPAGHREHFLGEVALESGLTGQKVEMTHHLREGNGSSRL